MHFYTPADNVSINLFTSNYTYSIFFVTRFTQSELSHFTTAFINRFCKNLDTLLIAYYVDFINAFYSYFIY